MNKKNLIRYILATIIFFIIFPPLPRFLSSLGFKISFTSTFLIIFMFFVLNSLNVNQKLNKNKNLLFFIGIYFLFLNIYACFSILTDNDKYILLKDFIFLFFPILYYVYFKLYG